MIIIKASCYALLNVLAIMAVMFKGIKEEVREIIRNE